MQKIAGVEKNISLQNRFVFDSNEYDFYWEKDKIDSHYIIIFHMIYLT